MKQEPYIMKQRIVTDYLYNPKYGDSKICDCGHTYDRHFDSYYDMNACGCKYCSCYTFKEES